METQFVDPNLAFEEQAAQVAEMERQQKLALLLRKRQDEIRAQTAQPEGQMVSGHYVAPAMSQRLDKVFQEYGANKDLRAEQARAEQIAQMQAQQGAAQRQHAEQWRSSLPQAIAAQQGTAPPDNLGGGPPTPDIPAQPVTANRILQHTLEGMRNPALKGEAAAYKDLAFKDMEREDKQAEAQVLKDQQLVLERERLKQAADIARQRAEDQRLSREDRLLASREANAIRLQIAGMTRGIAGAGAADRAADRKSAADDRSLERLGTKAALLSPLVNAAQQVQTLLDDNEGKSIAGVGYTGKLPGIMLSKAGNVNNAKVKMFANAMLRNQAGLSQTLSETENAQLEMLANGNYSEAEFRESWPNLMEKVNASVMATRAGYDPEVVSTFEGRGGQIAPIKSKIKPKVASKLSPQEEQELAALRARFPGAK